MAVLSDLLETIQLVAAWPGTIELRGEAVVRFHARARVTLHLGLAGSSRVRACDGSFERTLAEGHYLFVPAGMAHLVGGISAQPATLPAHEPDDRIPTWRFGQGPPRGSLISAELDIDQSRITTVARIIPEVKRQVPDGAPTVFALPDMLSARGLQQTALIAGGRALFHRAAEAMLVNAVRDRITSGNSASVGPHDVRAPTVAAALRLMYREPERPWNLATLAAAAGASRSVFAATFAAEVGITPIAFLTRVRMMRAEALLREDRHALALIAGLCGYRSETAFNRAFSVHSGVSPGAWRRAMRATTRQ
jgi:AraC-like DNA-binding protein